jgi:hypothetical protein
MIGAEMNYDTFASSYKLLPALFTLVRRQASLCSLCGPDAAVYEKKKFFFPPPLCLQGCRLAMDLRGGLLNQTGRNNSKDDKIRYLHCSYPKDQQIRSHAIAIFIIGLLAISKK